MIKKQQKQNKGFTIFIAVVLMSILLLISFAIVNISLKEIILATVGRDSQKAFYVSDIGLECALYLDFKMSTALDDYVGKNCGGYNIEAKDIRDESYISEDGMMNSATTTFSLRYDNETRCADVSIGKHVNISDSENPFTVTIIESRGYNTCDKENIRRVERAVRVKY